MPPELLDTMKGFWSKYRFFIMFSLLLILIGYGSAAILGKNNPIEQEVEKVLDAETGLDIKLTP